MVLLSIHAKVAVLKYAGHRVIDRVMLACIAAFGFVITHPSFRCIFFFNLIVVFSNRFFNQLCLKLSMIQFNDTNITKLLQPGIFKARRGFSR